MLTNGFAVFNGETAPSLALGAVDRVKRYARQVLVDSGNGFEELDVARLRGKRSVALAFSLERRAGGTFPLVHGFVDGALEKRLVSLPKGEFSLVANGEGGILAARDALGTRGLWRVPAGRDGAGSLASDYRMLGGVGRLLSAGAVYEKGRRMRTRGDTGKGRFVGSFEDAAKELASLLEESVKRRVLERGSVAVSFSGGLDSSVVAKVASRHTHVVLCSAYVPGSRDESQVARAAELLDLELEEAVMDEKTLLETAMRADLPPGDVTLMDRALWCIYSKTSELASRRKARTILLGQLADELFGGYMKYAVAAKEQGARAAERMMSQDVEMCGKWRFMRDEAACSAWAEVRFPFADSSIAAFAAGLPLEYKVKGEQRKAVLRAAALELGLPEELASAPKKAAQFSSGIAKLLKRRYKHSDSF